MNFIFYQMKKKLRNTLNVLISIVLITYIASSLVRLAVYFLQTQHVL
jgi:hypothetical protein